MLCHCLTSNSNLKAEVTQSMSTSFPFIVHGILDDKFEDGVSKFLVQFKKTRTRNFYFYVSNWSHAIKSRMPEGPGLGPFSPYIIEWKMKWMTWSELMKHNEDLLAAYLLLKLKNYRPPPEPRCIIN